MEQENANRNKERKIQIKWPDLDHWIFDQATKLMRLSKNTIVKNWIRACP